MDMRCYLSRMKRTPPRPRRCASLLCAAALLLAAALRVAGTRRCRRRVAPIIAQIDAGQFKAAEAAIADALAQPDVDAETQAALAFQRERMRRILLDFTLDADDVKARVRKQIPDLTRRRIRGVGRAPACSSTRSSTAARCTSSARPPTCSASAPKRVARRAVQTPIVDGPMEVAECAPARDLRTRR